MKYYEIRKCNNLIGVDACIETSLKEYGVAWNHKVKKALGDVRFYYGNAVNDENDFIQFDWADFKPGLDVYDEFDWVDWKSFYQIMGILNVDDWNNQPIERKIVDLYRCYGRMEIFGSGC